MKKRPASAVGYKRPISQYARVALAMVSHSRYRVGVSGSVASHDVADWMWLSAAAGTLLMQKLIKGILHQKSTSF